MVNIKSIENSHSLLKIVDQPRLTVHVNHPSARSSSRNPKRRLMRMPWRTNWRTQMGGCTLLGSQSYTRISQIYQNISDVSDMLGFKMPGKRLGVLTLSMWCLFSTEYQNRLRRARPLKPWWNATARAGRRRKARPSVWCRSAARIWRSWARLAGAGPCIACWRAPRTGGWGMLGIGIWKMWVYECLWSVYDVYAVYMWNNQRHSPFFGSNS